MTMEQGSSGTMTAIPVGAAVYTMDGHQFARVKSVRGGYFEVAPPAARDFWLSNAYVAEVRGSDVHLSIDGADVDAHRLDAPGIQTHQSATMTDRVIGDEQALTQRERMERELAAQRERMGIKREDTIEEPADMQSMGERDTDQPSAVEAEDIKDAEKDAEREARRAAMMDKRDSALEGRYLD
jgi:hypothetical protein